VQKGCVVVVSEGTLNTGTTWYLSTINPEIGGALVFAQLFDLDANTFGDGVDAQGRVAFNTGSTSPTARLDIGEDSELPTLKLSQKGSGDLLQLVSGTTNITRMVIQANGNVGIGVSNPAQKLQVAGTVQASIFSGDGSSLTGLSTTQLSGTLSVVNGGTGATTLSSGKLLVGDGTAALITPAHLHWDDTASRLGVNTSAPEEALHVVGNLQVEGDVNVTGANLVEQMVIVNHGSGPALVVNQTGSEPVIDVQADGVSVMFIDDAGNVGVGTNNPTEKVSVVGDVSVTGSITGALAYSNLVELPPVIVHAKNLTAIFLVGTWNYNTTLNNTWMSVCWAPELNLFVSVSNSGSGNRVMTSENGMLWQARSSAADNIWESVCWAPELYLLVAVSTSGTGNRVMTSPDGVTWTLRTSAADHDWRSVCWAPELTLLVAVANSGTGDRVMTSPDGITWTLQTSAADNGWRSVCWAPELSLLVAVSGSGTGNRVMTSPDGITWTLRTSAANNNWWSVCWAPGLSLLVAVSASGTGNRVMTSPDGITWTSRTSAADSDWRSVCWSPELSMLVAVANSAVMSSFDGISWTSRQILANSWRSIIWATELSLFVVVGDTGSANRCVTSPGGIPPLTTP
jgi:hypothetical protein